METLSAIIAAPPAPKLVPFVCPVCTASNAVGLIALVRAGTTTCVGCKRRLSPSDVARAMHAPRAASSATERAGFAMSGQRGLGGARLR